MSAADKFFQIINSKERVEEATASAVFDALEAIPSSDALVGKWNGASLETGHPAHQRLAEINWIGKDFNSADDVDPAVILNEKGERVVLDAFGKARVRQMIFRGVATASMIYDNFAIIDHFRRVNDETIMGAMDSREYNGQGTYYFYLTRLKE